MIITIRHKGLERFHTKGDASGVAAQHVKRLRRILTALEVASSPQGMNLPGFRLHPLKGELAGFWAVSVSGNWRVIFRFEGENATDVDLRDYH